jgi:hypothetical protein
VEYSQANVGGVVDYQTATRIFRIISSKAVKLLGTASCGGLLRTLFKETGDTDELID